MATPLISAPTIS